MKDSHALEVLRHLGANVRRLRRERGLTQEKLAIAAGIQTNYVQMIEYVKTNPSVKVLVNVADALGVEVKALLEPAEIPPAKQSKDP